jgi:RNA polymerase sigma-70 factor (ECF subfamily)
VTFTRAASPSADTPAASPAATLPPEQRRALLLAVFLGRTAREIGALDGTPIGTVKTRIRTATLRLHATLEVSDA